MVKKLVSHHGTISQLCVLLHIIPLIEWRVQIGMKIVPFSYTLRKIFCFVCRKQTLQQCRDETIGAFSGNCHFHCDSGALCSTGLETHHTSASQSMALTVMAAYPEVTPPLNRLFVLWEHSCWEQTTAEQWANSQRAPSSWAAPSFGSQHGTLSDAPCWSRACWGDAARSQDGVRPPPGRTVPQILLPLPALQLSWESYELLPPLLTESVQEARSAVSGGQQRIVREFVLCVTGCLA